MEKYFRASEDEILFELIRKDNPDMTPVLTTQNCYITTPAVNTGPDAAQYNTVATVRPRHGSGLHGPRQIKYNRVNLSDLFKDMQPLAVAGYSANEQYATRDEMPQILARCFSLPINKGDVDPTSSATFTVEGNAAHGTEVFKIANNKCFIGEVTIGFRRDQLENIANLIDPPVLNALNAEAYTTRGLADAQLPPAWAYFGEFDFTEILATVDHNSDFSDAQVAALAAFTGLPLTASAGVFNPEVPYAAKSHFGYALEINSANRTTASLVGKYPWLNTNYTNVKLTEGRYDPITGALIPAERRPVFAFYYNKYNA